MNPESYQTEKLGIHQKLEILNKLISKNEEEWAKHKKLDHKNGVIPATCHRCLAFETAEKLQHSKLSELETQLKNQELLIR